MRIITSYAYTLDVETAEEAALRFNIYRGVMDDWLRDQGINDPRADSPTDTYVQLKRRDISHEGAEIDGFLLRQPVLESSHLLHTRFDLAVSDKSLALFLQFSAERKTNRIAPASIPVGCPRALTTILDSGDWRCGLVRLRPHSRRILGADAGKGLRTEIMDPERTVPYVLLANLSESEEGWHQRDATEPYDDAHWEDFVNRLEDELGGLAQLVDLDTPAANALIPPDSPPQGLRQRPTIGNRTPEFSDWGMEGSLVRIIWPIGRQSFLPQLHPAWAPFEHYYEIDEDDGYDYPLHQGGSGKPPPSWVKLFRGHELMAVRPDIRDTIYEQAALQPVPELIENIRQRYADAERERLTASGDFEALEELYLEEIVERDETIGSLRESLERRDGDFVELQDKLRQNEATINQLRFQLEQAKGESETGGHAEDATTPPEPATVAEAIEIAKDRFTALSIGPRAIDRLDSLSPKAGPPRKILSDLEALNRCSQLLQDGGSLGQDVIAWLKAQNVNASKESSTRMNKYAAELTFPTDRDTYEQMGDHIKYRAAGLGREARIHFKVHDPDDGEAATIDIGYVGPKIMPD